MKQYLDLLRKVRDHGFPKKDRTGVGTLSLFGEQIRFDLSKGFPAVTTKKLAFKAVVGELLFFLEGGYDDRRLKELTYGDENDPRDTIWTANVSAKSWQDKGFGEHRVGRSYGAQWRKFTGTTVHDAPMRSIPTQIYEVDQVERLIQGIKADPDSRRHIVTAWNPSELHLTCLPSCHVMWQVVVTDGKVNLHMFQRSCDLFLGLAFNIASYALLTHMIAQVCQLQVGELVISISDLHIYNNHVEAVDTQLQRFPYPLPKLWINPEVDDIFRFAPGDFKLENYQHHTALKAPMAV